MEFKKYKEQQLAEKLRMMSTMNLSRDEFMKSFDKEEIAILRKDIQKTEGEDSRGGKIIGHTKSGKPIYEMGNKVKYFHPGLGKHYTGIIRDYKHSDDGNHTYTIKRDGTTDHHEGIKETDMTIHKSVENDISKSQKANIGETHIWNGKKFKKVAEGKWMEVSESHGLTKKEHENEAVSDYETDRDYYHGSEFGTNKRISIELKDSVKQHKEQASKLSDKDHTDEEVGLGKKEDQEIKVGQKYHSEPPKDGGEAIDFVIREIKDGKFTIETFNKEGRKGEHTFDEKTIKELISESKKKK